MSDTNSFKAKADNLRDEINGGSGKDSTGSTQQTQPDTGKKWTQDDAFVSSTIILVFGFGLFLVMAQLLKKGYAAMDIIRLCSLPLIIVGAIFLVVIGYSAEQIAPVHGLLGALAGYLLGTAQKPEPPQTGQPATPTHSASSSPPSSPSPSSSSSS